MAVAVALAGGTFWYFVLPLNDQRDSLQKEVAKLKAENDKNEAFRQQQTEYLNRIKQLESQLETLRSIVPDEQATDEFMKTVFADGASTGTQIRTFIPQASGGERFLCGNAFYRAPGRNLLQFAELF